MVFTSFSYFLCLLRANCSDVFLKNCKNVKIKDKLGSDNVPDDTVKSSVPVHY